MLRVTHSKSGDGAVRYFVGHLRQGDYLNAGTVCTSVWKGEIAERLGIAGQPVDAETFAAIVHNIDPRKVSKDEILRRVVHHAV